MLLTRSELTPFVTGDPDEFKNDDTIDTSPLTRCILHLNLGYATTIVVFLSVNLIGFDYE